jgi:hypothetical protein
MKFSENDSISILKIRPARAASACVVWLMTKLSENAENVPSPINLCFLGTQMSQNGEHTSQVAIVQGTGNPARLPVRNDDERRAAVLGAAMIFRTDLP